MSVGRLASTENHLGQVDASTIRPAVAQWRVISQFVNCFNTYELKYRLYDSTTLMHALLLKSGNGKELSSARQSQHDQ